MNRFNNKPLMPMSGDVMIPLPNTGTIPMMISTTSKAKPMVKPKLIASNKKPKTKVAKVTPTKRKPHRAFTKKKKSV